MLRRYLGFTVVAGAVIVSLGACGSSSDNGSSSSASTAAFATEVTGQPATHSVATSDKLTFTPAQLSIKVGDTVEWTNAGQTPHNVTFDTPPGPASSTIGSSQTYELKFTPAGSYHYICTFHSAQGMSGTITVQ